MGSVWRINDDEDILPAATGALDHMEAAVTRWRFTVEQTNLLMAAASLYQATRLVRNAHLLAPAAEPVGVNVLVRSAFEYWLIGAWLVFGGDDAIIGVELERYHWLIPLAERIAAADPDGPSKRADGLARLRDEELAYQKAAGELPRGRASKIVLLQIAERLGALIEARFPADAGADVTKLYDMLYRSHSTMDAHPPMTINQLVGDDRVLVGLEPWLAPRAALRVMTAHLLLLARWIDATREEPVQLWDDLLAQFKVADE